MINEKFIDIRWQRGKLESLLSKFKEKSAFRSAFDKGRYYITNSNGMFCGKYDYCNDRILLDKWFIYDSLCSDKVAEIENVLIHEEAHRQTRLQGTYESGKPDHWAEWLKTYLEMGGSIPQVYIKEKAYEHEKEYSEVKDEDIKNIIILGYKESENARKVLQRAKELHVNFIYVDRNRKIEVYG
ncbi:hypothetical protein M1558_01640 [Candidatus Parvarchaeota archaeon]|nr:hypothetical protein [Candidatus Parvarchaeota archaeon]